MVDKDLPQALLDFDPEFEPNTLSPKEREEMRRETGRLIQAMREREKAKEEELKKKSKVK